MDMSELSLLDLYNRLADLRSTYDEKISALYDMYKSNNKFPDGVTNTNDGPGLWPDTGINVYSVVNTHGLSTAFCDTGVILNCASAQYKFQLMLVETDTVDPTKNGRLYYRYVNQAQGAWTAWTTLATMDDLNALVGGKIAVDHAIRADRFTTPRKLSLTGAVNGSVTIDGTADATMPTVINGIVPINVILNPQYYSTPAYRLICTLPKHDTTNYDYALITGHVGGWEKLQGKASINITVSNRSGQLTNGLVIGALGGVDLIVVSNTDGTLDVYLSLSGWVGNCKLSVYGAQLTLGPEVDVASIPASSTITWTMSKDAALINGKTSNITTTGKSGTAGTADTSRAVHSTLSTTDVGKLIAVTGDNKTPFYSNDVKLNSATGVVTANEFIGKFTGTASHALIANESSGVVPINNNTIKAYLLGVPDGSHVPYYDAYTYLDVTAGKLHAIEYAGDKASFTTLNAGTANVSGLTTTYGAKIMGATPYINFNFANSSTSTSRLTATAAGTLTCTGEFTADRIHNAVWNDYAEYFPRGGASEPGDVIVLNVADAEESYVRSTEGATLVVGVHSDEYGHIIGGQQPPIGMSFADYNAINFIPVALAGRVHVNFVGPSLKGAKVVATNDGCARLYSDKTDSLEDVFGYLVESDNVVAKRRLRIKLR